MDLSAEHWRNITSSEREALALRLASELPSGFEFDRVAGFHLGEQQRDVALFRNGDASFAFIPGGIVTLGYDPNKDWEPNPDELESWQTSVEEYEIEGTIQDYLAKNTLPPRCVQLEPLLIETIAGELGWQSLSIDDPEVRELLREHGRRTSIQSRRADGICTRIRKNEYGQPIAERSIPLTHAQLSADLTKNGFRFPRSDEWEYACGAGAPTLFRWGDHVPCDRCSVDISPTEVSDWNYHVRPSAFGVLLASDPYKYELVAESDITRGGDGGVAICGGVGFFLSWLPLATAYFEDQYCRRDPTESILPEYTIGRRVLELR